MNKFRFLPASAYVAEQPKRCIVTLRIHDYNHVINNGHLIKIADRCRSINGHSDFYSIADGVRHLECRPRKGESEAHRPYKPGLFVRGYIKDNMFYIVKIERCNKTNNNERF